MGERPVEEFASRVNELMRFVIQKGMDVKHAGVQAVGTEVLSRIGKKGGPGEIMKLMGGTLEDQFKELKKFNEQIGNEAKLRLGELSTPDLMKELELFEPGGAEPGMKREEVIQKIIKKIDLEATLEELIGR